MIASHVTLRQGAQINAIQGNPIIFHTNALKMIMAWHNDFGDSCWITNNRSYFYLISLLHVIFFLHPVCTDMPLSSTAISQLIEKGLYDITRVICSSRIIDRLKWLKMMQVKSNVICYSITWNTWHINELLMIEQEGSHSDCPMVWQNIHKNYTLHSVCYCCLVDDYTIYVCICLHILI